MSLHLWMMHKDWDVITTAVSMNESYIIDDAPVNHLLNVIFNYEPEEINTLTVREWIEVHLNLIILYICKVMVSIKMFR